MLSPGVLKCVALPSITELVEIEFLEGSSQALEVILNVPHFRNSSISANISGDVSYEIVLMTDRYYLVEALRPWGYSRLRR